MKPLTRKEAYLARMAGEDVTMPEPLTREEAYMKGIAEAINGKNDVKIPEPLTREEGYLKTVTEKLIDATSDLIEKTVTENGVYTAKSDSADGYSKVTVNVPINTNNAKFEKNALNFTAQNGLVSITIPESVTDIGSYAFESFSYLENVSFPNGLRTIGSNAFKSTKISSIDLPSVISEIGNYAFSGCSSLVNITVRATTPPTLGTNALQNVPADANIYVPTASVDAYKAASGWSARADYIQAIPE